MGRLEALSRLGRLGESPSITLPQRRCPSARLTAVCRIRHASGVHGVDNPIVWLHDEGVTWRVLYRTDADAIVIADVTTKKTESTPNATIATCKSRLARYDRDKKEDRT